MPSVVLVCGEMNRMIDSIFSGISPRTPTYFPPPASTIEDISASLKRIVIAFHLLVVGRTAPYCSQPFRTSIYSLTAQFCFLVFHAKNTGSGAYAAFLAVFLATCFAGEKCPFAIRQPIGRARKLGCVGGFNRLIRRIHFAGSQLST